MPREAFDHYSLAHGYKFKDHSIIFLGDLIHTSFMDMHHLILFHLQWINDIGGYENLGEKLLKARKDDKIPTFVPPKVVNLSIGFFLLMVYAL